VILRTGATHAGVECRDRTGSTPQHRFRDAAWQQAPNVLAPGDGAIDWPAIVTMLDDVKYAGWIIAHGAAWSARAVAASQ
jgi:sugar phosphate isomerase/epimerase